MIRSFLRTALRHLFKNRLYAGLNILGLSVGLACFAIIGMWAQRHFSFDRMHMKGRRIYQVNTTVFNEVVSLKQAITPAPLAHALVNDLPEIENTVRIDPSGSVVQAGTQQYVEEGIIATDPSFFQFFDFKLLKGNSAVALSEPYSVVISEHVAKKYFGDSDPINQSLRIFQYDPQGNGADYKVTGIIENCPSNSHFTYSMLVSFKTIEVAEPESLTQEGWRNNEYYTYVMLKPLTPVHSLESKLPSFFEKYVGKEADGQKSNYFLTPLAEIHFSSDVKYPIQAGVSKAYIITLSAIGMIVLVLACFNYVSLATAYSLDQFTEVGIRKTLGASRRQVALQYLTESWLIAIIAMVASIGLIELAKPAFESIFGMELVGLYDPITLLTLFGVASLAGVLSGIYPSLMLSSFKTIEIVKGQFGKGTSGTRLRKSLVVVQYTTTIVLITGIITMTRQLNYIRNKDLGFRQDDLLLLATNGSPEVMPGYQGFANEVLSSPGMVGVARSNSGIGGGGLDRSLASIETAEGAHAEVNIFTLGIDHQYISTYEMGLVAGRSFIPGNASDSTRGYVINEAAVRAYGYRDASDALGKFFSLQGRDGEIIGVVKDFHFATMRERIEPVAMFLLNGYFSRITVRMNDDIAGNTLLLTNLWKKHFPGSVVDFSFLEDRLQGAYRTEDRFSKTFLVFSIVSVIIASLGLFALVSYHVERRVKEIGIRKILGGTVAGISAMLSKEFFFMVLSACILAIPIGWYFMDVWLQNFAYHISIDAGIFVWAALVNVVIATATVGLKTFWSATRNPVDSLRRE
ncbi:MAG TPA: ABC transporter permease [Chryseolinea sp.]|nr:ABC transporter permease [Chryseolinea sp.]